MGGRKGEEKRKRVCKIGGKGKGEKESMRMVGKEKGKRKWMGEWDGVGGKGKGKRMGGKKIERKKWEGVREKKKESGYGDGKMGGMGKMWRVGEEEKRKRK